jgi:hypothetical protein
MFADSSLTAEPGAPNSLTVADLIGSPSSARPFAGSSQSLPPSDSGLGSPYPGGKSPSAQPQGHNILVQVQAMDSQSFMDHSEEIAQAVRQAMLNLNSLNDVILDL